MVNRSVNYMPDRFRTVLRFQKTGLIQNVGNTSGNVRFTPTFAYDVDPVIGSTAMPGFTELAGIYRQYRVDGFRYKVSFSNNEAFAMTALTCPVNFDPGANTANFQNYLSNRRSKSKILGPLTGNGVTTMSGRVTVAEFAGLPDIRADDNTVGAVTGGSPNNNIWFYVGAYSPTNQVNGVSYDFVIDIDLEFFELATPAT
jgi:hypothetical protein